MIIKFQQGGGLPLVSYTPVITNQETSTYAQRPAANADDKKDLTTKDLMELLKEAAQALPNEYDLIINNFQDFALGSPLNTSTIETRYLSALSSLQKAKFNKELFDESLEIVKSKGALNEFAITAQGDLVCVNNEGDYKIMSPEELEKGYRPLTNSELLNLRAYSPDLVFNNNILSVIQNGISMEQVTKMIQDIVKELGTSESTKEGYTNIKNKQILDGINILKEAAKNGAWTGDEMSVDGLYKNKLITKSQAVQAKMALDYLKATLPKNAVTLLKIKSDGTNKGVDALLAALTTSYVKSSVAFETNLQDNKGNKSISDEKINPAMAFQLDMGTETTLPIVAGSTDALALQAYRVPVTTKAGNNIGITTLDKVASDSALGGIFDFSHVTMGDQVLDMASLKNIVIDGSSIFKVYLPYDQTKAAQGIIAPNLNYLLLLDKIRREIKEKGATTSEEINAIYQDNNLPPFILPSGEINEQFYKPFGVLNATALSDAFPKNVDLNNNRNFEEIDDDNEINNYWSILKGENTKEKFDSESWYEFDYQQMFKGLVYLPLNSTDPTLGAYSGGDTPSATTLNEYRALWQRDQKLNDYTNPGQLQL